MGWRDYLGFAPVDSDPKGPRFSEMGIEDVLDRYELIEAVDGATPYLLVADKPKKFADTSVDTRELGTSSPSPFTSMFRQEYNRDLVGIKGLEKYDKMRKGDGAVRGTLRLIKTPVLAARWFVEPASDSPEDRHIAQFVEDCLTVYPSMSWSQFLTESLLMCDFGYYMFEKVWEERVIDGAPKIVLKKLAPRHPMDVKQWQFDRNGGPAKVTFYSPNVNDFDQDITIAIEKMLVFTFDKEAGNIEGISVLRSAYKHWYYKEQLYKIDAIQKERHGIGIPVIKLPMGYSSDDKRVADELGRNLRTNERAHIVLPPNWDLLFAKLEGNMVDALKSIDHHNAMIRENVLGSFLSATTVTKDEDQIMFLKATRFIADIICDTINSYLIPELVKYNYGDVKLPKLKARRIGESADWRTLSFAVRNLVGSGIIKPDDVLEQHLREEMDLPMADPTTVREVKTPQAGPKAPEPARVGPPRQNPALPSSNTNAGNDHSGGQ